MAWRDLNTDIDKNSYILATPFTLITDTLIGRIIYEKYNYINDKFKHKNSIFVITAFHIDDKCILNINRDRAKTFPLQIINKYDYLIMTYKRQKHRDFIRRWKEAIYKPDSKYFYKIKDNFEKLKVFPNFP